MAREEHDLDHTFDFAKGRHVPVGGEKDAPSDLELFVEDLGLELRSADVLERRRFTNVPGHMAVELRTYNWPHEKSGAKYDRTIVITVFADLSFSCALQCEGHSVVSQRDELDRLVSR